MQRSVRGRAPPEEDGGMSQGDVRSGERRRRSAFHRPAHSNSSRPGLVAKPVTKPPSISPLQALANLRDRSSLVPLAPLLRPNCRARATVEGAGWGRLSGARMPRTTTHRTSSWRESLNLFNQKRWMSPRRPWTRQNPRQPNARALKSESLDL